MMSGHAKFPFSEGQQPPEVSSLSQQELQNLVEQLQAENQQLAVQIQDATSREKKVRNRLQRIKAQQEEAVAKIAAMESSKFWKLRSQWINLKEFFSFFKTEKQETNSTQVDQLTKPFAKDGMCADKQKAVDISGIKPSNEALSPEQLLLKELQEAPRYTPMKIDFLGVEIDIIDSASFRSMYEEIFKRQIYKFEADNQEPLIIDGGANIGLTSLYFKRLYPNSQIIAFEPDQKAFQALSNNVKKWNFSKIKLINKALWNEETTLEFMAEGADGGRVVSVDGNFSVCSVPTVRLRDYLNEPVDFLKIDIEGAETEVLKDCHDLLRNVKYAFVEYHSFTDRAQTLNSVVDVLADAGFRLHVQPVNVSPQPFCNRRNQLGMDMQLNIFAFRE